MAVANPYRRGVPPGVYEDRPAVARLAEVRMDVAAFIGLAERGPVDRAVPLSSFDDYLAWFGAPGGGRMLGQAVHGFFANGGRRCVVARAVDVANARRAAWQVPALARDVVGLPAPVLAARDPGAWGNHLSIRLRFTQRQAGLIAAPGIAWPEVALGDPGVAAGATLRRVFVSGGALVEEVGLVASVERRAGGLRVGLVSGLTDPGPDLARVTEVRCELTVSVPRWTERFADLALSPLHPAYAPDVLEGGDGRGQGSRLVSAGGPRDRWLPRAGLLLRGERELALVADDLAAGGDRIARGDDAGPTTGTAVFFAPGEGGLTPLEALDAHDEASEAEPISMVALPDLVHVRSAEAPVEPTDLGADPSATVFDLCTPPAAVHGVARPAEYPLLAITRSGARDETRARQAELVRACEGRELARNAGRATSWGRVALLDLPPGLTAGEIVLWRQAVRSDLGCAALFAPYLRAAPAEDPLAPLVTAPPCGACAGIVARVERERGVSWAPANAPVADAVSLFRDGLLPDAGFLHESRVNLIRPTEKGLFLLGSRTTSDDAEWTHLSVRRLIHWLERQLAIDTRWAVFEPNGRILWSRLVRGVEHRLDGLVSAGALAGRTRESSYFVRCSGAASPGDRGAGRVVVEVGVAPSAPAEFVVFQLVQGVDGTSLVEELPRG
ncbi:phage tail sheath family protein [Sorangium sp. So ce406]|uniref:phage tail sheath family protein n=1 Tax=Sorangium sp. So ce406 TaxID=3133311 RepID=UPI003F5CAB1B